MVELPDVVIIGTQKGATTFLQRGLEDHPGIRTEGGEWKHFEDPFFEGCEFSLSEDSTIPLVVKRAEYLAKPEVPSRIAQHIPNAQLVCVLRDPVDRAISAYYHNIKYGAIPVVNPEEGMLKILEGSWSEKFPKAETILTYGKYGEQLKKYFELFPPENILFFQFSEVVKRRVEALEILYRFCGIDENFQSGNTNRSSQAVVYSLQRLSFLRKIRRAGPPSNCFEGAWWYACEAIDRGLLSQIWQSKKPQLSETLLARLREYYQEDQAVLRKLELDGKINYSL